MKKIYLPPAVFLILVSCAGLGSAADKAAAVAQDEGRSLSSVQTGQATTTSEKNDSRYYTSQSDPFAVDPQERLFWIKGELKMGVEKWSGDNTYQIGFPFYDYATRTYYDGYFPFSELKFPLDVVMFAAHYNLEFKKRWMLSLGFKTDLDHSGDDMEDRDWLTADNPDRLDVYSESNVTEFDAYEYDVNVKFKYVMGRSWSLDAGIGYLYQKYKYETALKTQYSPSGLSGYYFVWDGQTPSLKYDVYYRIPYVQLGGSATFAKRFTVIATAAYSPIVHAEDEDQHLLRGKVNRGDLDGESWMVDMEARCQINRNWFVGLEYGYKKIEVDGWMKALFYEGLDPDHSVWEELESTQHAVSLMAGYTF
ncbi:MAG: omptin family outer membrane protease [Desulfurivibrionaceae bacterium]|nr:omptin family outer membrane protease [Desulfurivibrionaceae bacterium]